MKHFGLSLVVLGLALAAVPATAQETGQTTFTLETHTEGGGGYFTMAGQTAKNPALVVPSGQEITVTVKGTDDGVHNFCVGTACTEYVQAAGDSVELKFTASSSTTEYHCLPHKGAGMTGTVRIAGATTPTGNGGDDGEKDSPGVQLVGLVIALAGAALVIGRRTK